MSGLIVTSDKLSRSRSFSPAVKAGPFVYVSGAAPFDASKDIEGQTTEVFEYISQVLGEVNYSLQDVVKVQAFISSAEGGVNIEDVANKDPEKIMTVKLNSFNSLKEGYLFVINHRLLPGLYSLDIAVTVVSFYRQLFPVFALQLYGLGASGTGLLNTANSIGAVVGTLLVLYTSRFSRKGFLVLIATLIYAFLLLAFGLNKIFIVGLVIVGMLGAMDAVGMTMRQAVVQLFKKVFHQKLMFKSGLKKPSSHQRCA